MTCAGRRGDEPYAGPPPTRRPERWDGPPPAAAWPPRRGRSPCRGRARCRRRRRRRGCAGRRRRARRRTTSPSRTCSRCGRGTGRGGGRCSGLLLLGVVYVVAATRGGLPALATGVGPDFAQLDLVDPLTAAGHQPLADRRHPGGVAGLGRSPTACGRGWSSSVLARLRWRLLAAVRADGAGHPRHRHRRCRCWSASCWGTRGHRAGRLVRLAARGRRPHHAAAVGGGGVPVPRLPEPGDRRLGAAPRARARWSPAW